MTARRRRPPRSGPCCRRPARRSAAPSRRSAARPVGAAAARSRRTRRAGPSRRAGCRAPVAISVGGGRTALSVRMAVDVWAASVRRGTGPIASRPPASQTMRSAWAAPVKPPADRSAAPRNPLPSEPRGRPADRRADRFADPDRQQQAGQHDVRAHVDGNVVERLDEDGQRQDEQRAAADGAEQAADLGQRSGVGTRARRRGRPAGWRRGRAGSPADRRTGVMRMPRAGRVRGIPGWSRVAGAGAGGSADRRPRPAGRPPPESVIVHVPAATSGISNSVMCCSAIAMHATSCGPLPSRRVIV